jgi:uncharacterized protein YraI
LGQIAEEAMKKEYWLPVVLLTLASVVVFVIAGIVISLLFAHRDNESPESSRSLVWVVPISPHDPAPVAQVNAANVNLRTGPGINYPVLRILPEGQAITLLGRMPDNAWLYVQLADTIAGWINADYVTGDSPITDLLVANNTASTASSLEPSISVGTTLDVTNSEINIAVYGFPAYTRVRVRLGTSSDNISPTTYAEAYTDYRGSGLLSFEMPTQWANGTPITTSSLVAMVSTDDGRYYAWSEFRVTFPSNTTG